MRTDGKSGKGSASGKSTSTPTLVPVQFRCMVKTRAGHAVRRSQPLSSSTAYSVMRKNHLSSSFWMTTESHRQQRPSSTCSSASTVSQLGHQFTAERFLYARLFSKNLRKSHWFHL